MLNMGCKPMMHSSQILAKTKHWNDCILLKKLFRSCPVVSLRVGIFHKMDKGRGSAFVKFILQRTFVLVLQTNVKMNMQDVVTVFLPKC